MDPNQAARRIDYKRLHELSEEFTQLWDKLHAFYLDASVGFTYVRNHVETEQAQARAYFQGSELDSEEFQDTCSFTYSQIFAENFCASSIHFVTQGEVKARNALDGANFATLGQLCIVSFYDFWNDYLRKEYAIAKGHLDPGETGDKVIKGCLKIYASHDIWGDLRILRQSIVHNQGIATSDVERCNIIKWFKPGDPMSITPEHMRAIFLALLKYRNELFEEQFPQRHFRVPSSYSTQREDG